MSEVDEALCHHVQATESFAGTETASERMSKIKAASQYITSLLPDEFRRPRVGMICGSGLAYLGDLIEHAIEIPFADIPHFPMSTVKGHGKKIVVGRLNDVVVICLLGRFHIYEGHTMHDVAFPVYTLADMQVESLILTNSAGALNESFGVGDIMIIEDHISFVGLAGFNPLRGENLDAFGPRFPSMTMPYYERSYEVAIAADCPRSACRLQRGVYVGVGGPTFETRAEVKFLTLIGGHAVGMSTTPEVICANHASIRVVGLSLITNIQHSNVAPSHEEVLSVGEESASNMIHLVSHFVSHLNSL